MNIRVKAKINNIITVLLAVVAIVMMSACGGDDKKEPSPLNPVDPAPEVHTYQQSVTLPSEDADETIELVSLTVAVKDIEYDADWLTVSRRTYTSGSPYLRLTATDNVEVGASTVARHCTVTITADCGDKVQLSVTQEGAERRTGIDDSHDVLTDQPAYSRER